MRHHRWAITDHVVSGPSSWGRRDKANCHTDDRGSYHLSCSQPPYLSGDLRDLAEALAFAPRLLEEMTLSATHPLLDARKVSISLESSLTPTKLSRKDNKHLPGALLPSTLPASKGPHYAWLTLFGTDELIAAARAVPAHRFRWETGK
jgi:hypothetical protein